MAFSDGVVAIAITVLVLPLVNIDLAELGPDPVPVFLHRYGSLVAGFLISWLVIINFWLSHHELFVRVARADSALMWLSILWLLGIVSFPFPSGLIWQSPDGAEAARLVTTVYVAAMLWINLCTSMMWRHVGRRPELQHDPESAEVVFRSSRAWASLIVFALTLVCAQWFEQQALWLLLLLFPAGILAGRIGRPAERPAL